MLNTIWDIVYFIYAKNPDSFKGVMSPFLVKTVGLMLQGGETFVFTYVFLI